MKIQLAFIIQLGDNTEGLHGSFGHILISLGATAILVFCSFVSGSVIISVMSRMRALKTLCTMAHIHVFEESFCDTTNYKPCKALHA